MPGSAVYPPFEAIHHLYTLASSTSALALLSIDPSAPLDSSSLLRAAESPLDILAKAALPSASPSAVRTSTIALFHVTAALYAFHARPLFGNRYAPPSVLNFLYAHMVDRIAANQERDDTFEDATVSEWLTSASHEWNLLAAYCSSSFQLSGFSRLSHCAADFLNYLAFILQRASLDHPKRSFVA